MAGETGSHGHFVNDLNVMIQLEGGRSAWRGLDLEEIQEEIGHELEDIPGITINLSQPIAHNLDELITGSRAQLAVRVFGENADTLAHLSEEHHRGLWGSQEYYRAMSLVNGGRAKEGDLFDGLR